MPATGFGPQVIRPHVPGVPATRASKVLYISVSLLANIKPD